MELESNRQEIAEREELRKETPMQFIKLIPGLTPKLFVCGSDFNKPTENFDNRTHKHHCPGLKTDH